MKLLIFALYIAFTCSSLSAQTNGWQPSPGHTQVPIWPGAVPDPRSVAGPEIVKTSQPQVPGGWPVVFVDRVSQPTMTVYSPKATNTGVAIVCFLAEVTTSWPLISKAPRFVIG